MKMKKYLYETQDFLKQAYEKGGYFCTHGWLAQVLFSQAQNCFYFVKIAKKTKKAPYGFAKRGYINTLDECTAKRWIAEGLKNGHVCGC